MKHASRSADFSAVSAALTALSDQQLTELLDRAAVAGTGIGGQTFVLDIAGSGVFVKRIPLTARERWPENRQSTANLFDLPAFCHYGIGSPGFGAWRELALHQLTSFWVLDDHYAGFPVLYDWRVLPETAARTIPEELRDIDAAVHFWEGSVGVRERLIELKSATASLVLFLEYVPYTLAAWLTEQLAEGDQSAGAASVFVDEQLGEGVAFMNDHGLLHFDAHFENILTDGTTLFFSDFGLAMHTDFDLSSDEVVFFHDHLSYDRTYAESFLVRSLTGALGGPDPAERQAFIRQCATGTPASNIPARVADIIAQHAPIAAMMDDFYRALQNDSRLTPYPVEDIERLYSGR